MSTGELNTEETKKTFIFVTVFVIQLPSIPNPNKILGSRKLEAFQRPGLCVAQGPGRKMLKVTLRASAGPQGSSRSPPRSVKMQQPMAGRTAVGESLSSEDAYHLLGKEMKAKGEMLCFRERVCYCQVHVFLGSILQREKEGPSLVLRRCCLLLPRPS